MDVNNICCLIFFIFVLSSSPIINNFHRPFSVTLSYFIGCLLNDVYVFKSFPSHHHLVANEVKKVDERGRKIMCVRTLPSLLVNLTFKFFHEFFTPICLFWPACNSISLMRGHVDF